MVETRSQEIRREVISLREHFEELRKTDREEMNRRFIDAEKSVKSALDAADKAVNKAETASKERADASNEIRKAMIDQQSTFVTKPEHNALERRIAALEEANNRLVGADKQRTRGQDTGFQWVGTIIAAMSIIAGVVIAFVIEKVSK